MCGLSTSMIELLSIPPRKKASLTVIPHLFRPRWPAPRRRARNADRHRVGHARWMFLTWCADSDIAEVRQLATTVDHWWPEIEAFIDTGHHNAKSQGIN